MKKIIPLLGLGLLALPVGRALHDRQDDYDVSLEGVSIPTYQTHSLDFDQANDFSVSLPFMASAILDIDGDGVEELFLGGAQGQSDALFAYLEGELRPVENVAGLVKPAESASMGALALDIDHDRDTDLLVAREDGVWAHRNRDGLFDSTRLDIEMPEGTVALSIAVADLNRDGAFDLFVSGYIRSDLVEGQNIFNREGYGGSSRLFLNRGDDTFRDITEEAGLAYVHNTFQSIFIDVDRDGDEDLVVAHDTGQVRTWRNDGGLRFTLTTNPVSDRYAYPMGIAVSDLGNDGLADFFFSNVGSTPPDFMIRGDLRNDQASHWDWILLESRGDFRFEETAQRRKLADYEFSWGAVFADLNLDGRDDLVVSENYVGFPLHKIPFLRLNGRLLLQTPSGEFAPSGAAAGVVNRAFSISPLVADFNNDGYPDIVHANLNGASKLFLSEGGRQGYLKVRLPEDVSSVAAWVEVTLSNGERLMKPYVSGEGLCSDSSRVIIAGLGDLHATKVSVAYLDGRRDERAGHFRNELLEFYP